MYTPRRQFRRSPKRNNFFGQKISHSKYIAKAEPILLAQPYIAKHKFSDFGFSEIVQRNIAKKNYTTPTKIQDQAIQHILEGNDLIGLAQTGSGKTAAFLLPMINKAVLDPQQRILIIAPTRELAMQIQSEFIDFAYGTNLKSVLVIGGASMRAQIDSLNRRPHFVIGTPGRLKDITNRGVLKLEFFNNVILDEVDRMLDMGFITDIKFLIAKLRTQKQSLFFSATMSKEASSVANSLLHTPIKIAVDDHLVTSKNVEQDIVRVNSFADKSKVLSELLQKEEFKKILIFVRTKRGADQLANELYKQNFKVSAIHGDKAQSQRGRIIANFKQDMINILVATDVAARGLDIPDISHVINYDEPANFDDYIHRIGRTGRSGKRGKALTFVH